MKNNLRNLLQAGTKGWEDRTDLYRYIHIVLCLPLSGPKLYSGSSLGN